MKFHYSLISIFLVSFFAASGCSTSAASKFARSTQNQKETESAISAVTETLRNENVSAQYCPVCGKHYSGRVEKCLIDGTPLKEIEK